MTGLERHAMDRLAANPEVGALLDIGSDCQLDPAVIHELTAE